MAPLTAYAAARWLVRHRRVSVIPIDHPAATRESDPQRIGKVPRLASWKLFQTALPTDDNLRTWFREHEPRNVGIVCGALSHLVAVDADNEAALTWMRAHLPATPMRTKSSRGEHWFFRHPGSPVRNRVRLHTDDPTILIDVRASGGSVVAPPSVHASVVRYERRGPWPPVEKLPPFNPAWITSPRTNTPPRTASSRVLPEDQSARLRRARAYVDNVPPAIQRSEERRVGKECRSRWSRYHKRKKEKGNRRQKTEHRE